MSREINRPISVVIPARNEALRLPAAVEAIHRSAKHAGFAPEIVVVDNRSTDDTVTVAVNLGCRVVSDPTKNLSHIRNTGVRATSNPIVVTVDADSLVSMGFFAAVGRALNDSRIVGGGVLIFPERWSLGIVLTGALVGILALYYGITGGAFFFRRADFEAIGGFDEGVLSAEDIDFARRLKRHARSHGNRFANLYSAHIVTSCRKFDTFGDWYILLRPWLAVRLLRGNDRTLADRIWYDYTEN
jgi:glycosyltransferase involved in cell wall biosynthesis